LAEILEVRIKLSQSQEEKIVLKNQLDMTNKSLLMQGTELMELTQKIKNFEQEKTNSIASQTEIAAMKEKDVIRMETINQLGKQLDECYAVIDNLNKRLNESGRDTDRFEEEEEEQKKYIVEIEAKLKFLIEDHERLQEMFNSKMKEHLMETKLKNEIILKLERKIKELDSQTSRSSISGENQELQELKSKYQTLEQENQSLREFKRKIFQLQQE
jgi:hypothetical protein